jgi:hypothetical protein
MGKQVGRRLVGQALVTRSTRRVRRDDSLKRQASENSTCDSPCPLADEAVERVAFNALV